MNFKEACKILDIKETNQFIIPRKIRYIYPIIYITIVFSLIKKIDDNKDNFLDVPLAKQINIMNRWQYQDLQKGWVSFLSFRYLSDEKQAGEIDFNPSIDKLTTNSWGSEINTNRVDVTAKVGYVFPEIPYQSFGFQIAYSKHRQES